MNNTLIFTGNAGPGVVTAAAATALRIAAQGRRTLLYSLATSPVALSALLGTALTNAPTMIAPDLDALALEPLDELRAVWEQSRPQFSAQTAALTADELPLLPGIDAFLGLWRLRALAPAYDMVVLDAGPHDGLLRMLAAPDSLRWLIRLLLGLERGPGRSSASVDRALLPTVFIPLDIRDRAQAIRIEAEQARDELVAVAHSASCYVLRPDTPALEEARLAVPALHLHGLAVSALLAGPLLPAALGATSLAPMISEANAVVASAQTVWPTLPVSTFTLQASNAGQAALQETSAEMTLPPAPPAAPITYTYDDLPAVVIALPGLPKGALQLTVSSDELIIRIGPYRRHILLPEVLRGTNVRATREGEALIVRVR